MNPNLVVLESIKFEIRTDEDKISDMVRKALVDAFAKVERDVLDAFGGDGSEHIASLMTGMTVGMVQIAISFSEVTDESHMGLRDVLRETVGAGLDQWRGCLGMPPLPAVE